MYLKNLPVQGERETLEFGWEIFFKNSGELQLQERENLEKRDFLVTERWTQNLLPIEKLEEDKAEQCNS